MSNTISSIEYQIEQLEKERDDLNLKLAEKKALSGEIQLAEYLHDKLCIHNHTDGCGWFYGKWTDTKLDYARTQYLAMAIRILKKFEEKDIVEMIESIKERTNSKDDNLIVIDYLDNLEKTE